VACLTTLLLSNYVIDYFGAVLYYDWKIVNVYWGFDPYGIGLTEIFMTLYHEDEFD
jgi:hypothetical protein